MRMLSPESDRGKTGRGEVRKKRTQGRREDERKGGGESRRKGGGAGGVGNRGDEGGTALKSDRVRDEARSRDDSIESPI